MSSTLPAKLLQKAEFETLPPGDAPAEWTPLRAELLSAMIASTVAIQASAHRSVLITGCLRMVAECGSAGLTRISIDVDGTLDQDNTFVRISESPASVADANPSGSWDSSDIFAIESGSWFADTVESFGMLIRRDLEDWVYYADPMRWIEFFPSVSCKSDGEGTYWLLFFATSVQVRRSGRDLFIEIMPLGISENVVRERPRIRQR